MFSFRNSNEKLIEKVLSTKSYSFWDSFFFIYFFWLASIKNWKKSDKLEYLIKLGHRNSCVRMNIHIFLITFYVRCQGDAKIL